MVKSQTKRFAYKDWTLIDLSSDIEERQDLTAKHPEIAENLRERWERWERQNASHPPIGHDFKDDTEGQASFKR